MKRRGLFVFFLFIILIIGGLVFYIGWIQIQLDEHSYAVVFTKLRGYEDTVIGPGTFTWRWERLIPTNTRLHIYTLSPQEEQVSISGSLPSADVYGRYLEGSPDFTYDLSFSLSFQIRPDALPALTRDKHITPDTLGSWYKQIISRCQLEATALIQREMRQASENTSSPGFNTTLGNELSSELSNLFPELEFIQVQMQKMRFPDFDLYRKGKEMYMAVMTEKEAAEEEALRRSSSFVVNEEVRLTTLKKYGELLTEYPILLDYMKIGGHTDLRDIDVGEIISQVE
ncbi:MAG: hypothetical protein JW760_02760 [Spirochaetales bacterium]|nr:hypothetical protein [Spirochaetales bacterium]